MKKERLLLYKGSEGSNRKRSIESYGLLPEINQLLDEVQKFNIKIENVKELRDLIIEGQTWIIERVKAALPVEGGFKRSIDTVEIPPFDFIIEQTNFLKKHHSNIHEVLQVIEIKKGKATIDEDKVKELDERSSVYAETPQQVKSYKALKEAVQLLNEFEKSWPVPVNNFESLFWKKDSRSPYQIREHYFKEVKQPTVYGR